MPPQQQGDDPDFIPAKKPPQQSDPDFIPGGTSSGTDTGEPTQKMAPGTFQTQPGGDTYNANDLGSKPITYPTEGAAVSGAKARTSMSDFPDQLQGSLNKAADYAPTAGALTGGMFGLGGAALGAGAGRLAEPSIRANAMQPPGWEDAKAAAGEAAGTYAGGKLIEAAAPVVGRVIGSGRQVARDVADKYLGKTMAEAVLPTPEPVVPQGPQQLGDEEFTKVHGGKLDEAFSTRQKELSDYGKLRDTEVPRAVQAGTASRVPTKMPRVSGGLMEEEPGQVDMADEEGYGSGRRPAPLEREGTRLNRKLIVSEPEYNREQQLFGDKAKVDPKKGLFGSQASKQGTIYARRAGRGMKEPRP
jgi:hypothetical protein